MTTFFISLSLSARPRLVMAALACTAMLSTCTVGPNFNPHEVRNENYRAAPDPSPDWWDIFNDPLLSSLVARAQADNADLLLAASRIEESRAQLGISNAGLMPQAGFNASYTREEISEHGKFAALGAPAAPVDFWQLGFDTNWEIDLWGRAHRLRESATATLNSRLYDRKAVQVSVNAEVARTYLQLRSAQTQLGIAQQNLDIAAQALKIAQSRERNGIATRFETASALALSANLNASVAELRHHCNVLMNALALLLNESPHSLEDELRQPSALPRLPGNVPPGIASEYARRRPDILSAEAALHAATAAIGVAKADFYPRISLKGRVGVEAFQPQDLSGWDAHYFSVGPVVYLPIFQGGRLQQQVALTEAHQKTAAIAYRKTVLLAWHEIDNALDAWSSAQAQHEQRQTAYEQDQIALQVAQRGYAEGSADYLVVLTAQRNALASQTLLNTSATNLALAIVNLYKSLGGGWDMTQEMP